MQKTQKTSFIISSSIFVALGIIFLIAGLAARNTTLKIMGAIWLPLGIIYLLLVLWALRKER